MISLTCRRNAMKFTQKNAFLTGYSVRNFSVTSIKFADIDRQNDTYKLNLPLRTHRLVFEVGSNDTLKDFESNIKSADSSISKVNFFSVDGGVDTSFLPKSEKLQNLEKIPFLLTLNNSDTFVVNFGEKYSGTKHVTRKDIFEPNEEAFHLYAKSIGIPNKNSETIAAFLDKTYASIPTQTATTEDIKASMFNALAAFRSLPNNRWGTTKVPELKKILDKKEKELVLQHGIKEKLDQKALRRANTILYLGGTVIIGQFR